MLWHGAPLCSDNVLVIEFKKSGISVGRMDYGFRVTIIGNDSKVMGKFIINSNSIIRKNPFFYEAHSESNCYDCIEKLFE